ncbi:hypothetical protein DsansV1_C10g0098141 [Dioscorea sansibarensis]
MASLLFALVGDKMSGFQCMKGKDLKKPSYGCMGRLMDRFDSNGSVTANKLLTESSNSQFDGSVVHNSCSDVLDNGRLQVEDKVDNDQRNSSSEKELGVTPTSLALEVSRYKPSKKPENVVARLMGLDMSSLPAQPPVVTTTMKSQYGCSANISTSVHQGYKQLDKDRYFDATSRDSGLRIYEKELKDAEPWTFGNERSNETINTKRTALVHHILATNGQLLQSKELQNAAEALSSDQDFYLKFVGEPNPFNSNHFRQLESYPPKNRIVVLKPSKLVDMESEKYIADPQKHQINASSTYSSSDSLQKRARIVVLKPKQRKPRCIDSSVTSNILAPKLDKALISLLSFNSYARDDSSVSNLENDDSNFNDSDIVTPTSHHSSEYTNRLDDHNQSLNLPNLSVDRLAKKQISDRWALLISNPIYAKEDRGQKRSTTLGELLSIPKVQKDDEGARGLIVSSSKPFGEEQDPSFSAACLGNMRTLSRSKSLSSSSTNEGIGLDTEASGVPFCKSMVTKNSNSSLRGKVLHLFSNWNKRQGGVRTMADQNENHACPLPSVEEDQPSPDSVLAAPFEDASRSSESKHDRNARLLSRSIPIQSVTRHFTWDDSDMEAAAALQSSRELITSLPKSNEEEQNWFSFIHNMLVSNNSTQLDSPNEVNLRLMFDCVNEALSEISKNSMMVAYRGVRACNGHWKQCSSSSNHLVTQVWELIRYWISYTGNNALEVVDKKVKREVGGSEWDEKSWREMGVVIEEICDEVLGEFIGEVLAG